MIRLPRSERIQDLFIHIFVFLYHVRRSYRDPCPFFRQIIEEAVKANEGSNFKEIGAKMDELMESWKQLGHAGKEFEEDLWAKFKEQRTKFFKNRKAYYESMKETYAKRTEDKKALIAEAKLYLARSEFSEDEVEAVKGLRARWKEIGSAGRENEDTLWEEFNGVVNKYYDNMRYYRK